jgi:hypothetical protein
LVDRPAVRSDLPWEARNACIQGYMN